MIVAAAVLLCLLLVLCTEYRTVLVIESRTHNQSWTFDLPDDTFTLGFTHSVMKTPVEDLYKYESSAGLVLVRSVYQSYGVGLPFLPEEGDLVVEDGRFTLQMRREIGTLNMVLSDIPDHWLEINGERYALRDLPEIDSSISLYGKRLLRLKQPSLSVAALEAAPEQPH